jgi:Flp pilus assembly protein TadB
MWYPNRGQWAVFWTALVVAFLLWMDAKEFVGAHLFIVIAALFLVWMLEGRRKP